MKILVTGGHLTPALAVIDEIERFAPKNTEIIFAGRKYALDHEKTVSLEYQEITKRGIKFFPLRAGRLTRSFSWSSLRAIFRLPLGFWDGLLVVAKEKPNCILSFGGYLALPIAFWAFIFGIPVYTHEQTISPGLANRIIGLVAKKIFVSFKEARDYFNPRKTIITGNPLRESIFDKTGKTISVEVKRPTIYITGGSLGSHSLNVLIIKILPQLLKKYNIIHQVGDTKEYQDYEKLLKIKAELGDLGKYYYPRKHFFDNEIGYIYSLSDLVVGRAGANTFFELLALKKPALFIPLPWAAGGEQMKHALIFEKAKTGRIFNQKDDSQTLLTMIETMMENISDYRKNFHKLNYLCLKDASATIAGEILKKV